MKRSLPYILILTLSFFISIFITIDKFNDIKYQYSKIEPNLDNYSAAEIMLVSFQRLKINLLEEGVGREFVINKKIFDSKIKILENRSVLGTSFSYSDDFISLLNSIRYESIALDKLYYANKDCKRLEKKLIKHINSMQGLILDLQEKIYLIQIKNFNKSKQIIKDNSYNAQLYSIFCIILFFMFIAFFWIHIKKLRKTLSAKNLFISAIYHELSSSIQKIQISSEILIEKNDITSAKKYINRIKLHSDKIFYQTKEILEYSKIEIGNVGLIKSRFKLIDLLGDLLLSFEGINNNQLIIKSTSTGKMIKSDKPKLYSIIKNLVDNADKNTQNGVIRLVLKLIDNKLYIYVKDNGCGFDIKNLKYLYRPFNQGAEKSTKQGLGLGLTIIKNYVKTFGGTIRVKSRPNVGSSFLIRIHVSTVTID